MNTAKETNTDTIYDDTAIQAEVDLNTAKVGITPQQAADIVTNNAKVGVTTEEANPDVVSQVEAEAGIATDERIWTAQRVKQAIDALAVGGAGVVQSIVAGTNVTVDASDPANPIVSSSGGSGASNPNIFIPTTQANLSDVANINKIASIQSDITLTSNLTLASGLIIRQDGGHIILNGFDIIGDLTQTFEVRNEDVIFDCGSTGTITGLTPPTSFYVTNFGVVNDGKDHRTAFTIDKSGTGSISSGSTTLVVSDANFDASRVGQKIVVFNANTITDENALHTTIASVTNATTVELSDAANATVSETRVFYGSDNYNQIYQALTNTRNNKSGELIFPEGHYMTSTIEKIDPAALQQDGFLIGDGTDNISIVGYNATLQAFAYDYPQDATIERSFLFDFYKTRFSEMKGMNLVGSYFSALWISEYPAGINFNTGAIQCKLIDSNISEFQGDGLVFAGDTQFQNYIQGANTASIQDSDLSIGRILGDGTIDVGQTDYVYSTTLLPINTSQFTNFQDIAKYGIFALTGGSFAGWSGLTTQDYEAAIYDGLGNFVTFLSDLTFADDVYIQAANWEQIRVHFKDVVDKEDIDVRLRCNFNSRDTRIANTNVFYNGRQGMSNGTTGLIWDKGQVHNNGGRSPGYGIDIEDNRRNSKNIKLLNLELWDNDSGDIAAIGTENLLIQGCNFKASTRPDWGSSLGINANYTRDLLVTNCHFRQKSASLNRAGFITSCYFDEGTINMTGIGVLASNIQMIQGQIDVDGINTEGFNKQGLNSRIENVTIRMYKEFSYILSDRNVLGQWKNINIYLNDSSTVSNLVTGTTLNASLGTDQTLWEELAHTTGQPYGGGFIDGLKLEGNFLTGASSEFGYYARFPQYPWTRDIDVKTGIELGVYGIGAIDITWENLKCNGVNMTLSNGDYLVSVPADPIANPAPVWTFKNAQIINEANEYDMTALSFRQVEIEDKWIDVVFEDSKIINNEPYVQILNRSSIFQLDNYGKVTFKDCVFGNKGSQGTANGNDIKWDSSWFRNVGRTYPIEMINPILLEGEDITYTSDDFVAFTKANSLMLTYTQFADEAAAVTAGYPSGYLYVTATGEIRMKL